MKIVYADSWVDFIAGYSALNIKKTKKEPLIIIGPELFFFTYEEQKGVIAHEIGHHKNVRGYTIPKIKRENRWNQIYHDNEIPDSRPHWKQRLETFYTLNDIAADNELAHTKYGKTRLEAYKKYLSPNPFNEISKKLIKNLEEKLGEKDER